MRVFFLYRKEDVTGISGTGWVAAGIQLPGGKCLFGWLTKVDSVCVHDSMDKLQSVHCHQGKTEVVYDDLDWVDKDGYPIVWAAEGFYYFRPGGGGPEWPNEKSFKTWEPVRPSHWLKVKSRGAVAKDPLAWEKMCAQFDDVVASMGQAADAIEKEAVARGDTVTRIEIKL